jgi:hypothetical protein
VIQNKENGGSLAEMEIEYERNQGGKFEFRKRKTKLGFL